VEQTPLGYDSKRLFEPAEVRGSAGEVCPPRVGDRQPRDFRIVAKDEHPVGRLPNVELDPIYAPLNGSAKGAKRVLRLGSRNAPVSDYECAVDEAPPVGSQLFAGSSAHKDVDTMTKDEARAVTNPPPWP
jgi:hypothetical protein